MPTVRRLDEDPVALFDVYEVELEQGLAAERRLLHPAVVGPTAGADLYPRARFVADFHAIAPEQIHTVFAARRVVVKGRLVDADVVEHRRRWHRESKLNQICSFNVAWAGISLSSGGRSAV